ncbi:MAG: cellulase family glycosylhydrolase [Anaerolineae bacterium]
MGKAKRVWTAVLLALLALTVLATGLSSPAPPGFAARLQNDRWLYLPLVTRSYHSPLPETRLGYGIALADLGNMELVWELGFNWVQGFVAWADVEPQEGAGYNWADVDNIIATARSYGIKVLLRVDRPPAWARRQGTTETGPVRADKLDRFAAFLTALARRGRGTIAAYEIWNEPNLASEWGGRRPDPAYYVTMLRYAYPAIKAGDPEAVVVSAGMASTGQRDDSVAMGDLLYIQRMYEAGARDFFDVLGSQPHGFGRPPEIDPTTVENGFCFRRAEQQRAIMERYGDGDKQMWVTEFGWLLDPGPLCYHWGDWPTRTWQMVSEETQADYLVRAFQYAYDHWPWMGVMILFNLDFGADYWQAGCPGARTVCNPMRFYSLVDRVNPCDPDHNPIHRRRAFFALQEMPKR